MANFVLDKGFKVEGAAAAVAYRFVGFGTANWSVTVTPTANGVVAGVLMENVDAAKVATGKVIANVRMMGIAPVKVGSGGVTRGTYVMTDATGQAITATGTPTTNQIVGLALETGAAGDIIDVLLTPGGQF